MTAPVEYFRTRYGQAVEIGRGMEGVVYDLGGGLVGKHWFDRRAEELGELRAFMTEVAAELASTAQGGTVVRVPVVKAVDEVDGRAVTVEAKLAGVPLSQSVDSGAVDRAQALALIVDVVEALGRTTAGPASRRLPVLGRPFWPARTGQGWGRALAGLIERRAKEAGAQLRNDVEDLDRVLAQLVEQLSELEISRLQVVHGDICPPNLLVGDGEIGLLDWGFFSTAGDTTFEAATAAAFFDMYGPEARETEESLLTRFEELGHSRRRMELYRAAYAICTATIYSADASDGHYRWCVENLRRFKG